MALCICSAAVSSAAWPPRAGRDFEHMTGLHSVKTLRDVPRERFEHSRDKEPIVEFGHLACE